MWLKGSPCLRAMNDTTVLGLLRTTQVTPLILCEDFGTRTHCTSPFRPT